MQGCVHIVDDDASFRTAMERRLTKAGYEVATYASAQHCWIACRAKVSRAAFSSSADTGTERPGAVRAPERTGFDAAHHIPHGHPDIPAVVRAIKAGADDFLTKPVSSDDLLQAIERAIAHHEVTRALKSKLDVVRAHVSALTPRE